MELRASNVALSPRERVEIKRPRDLRRRYEAIARGTGIFLLLPGAICVLMVLFLMPFWFGAVAIALMCSFLHLTLLLVLLALINAVERPLVAVLWRGLWPVHRWWLAHYRHEEMELVVHRDILLEERPSSVSLDEESGLLVTSAAQVDLSQPFEMALERCELPQNRLRVRISNLGGGRGVVFCTNLPRRLCRTWFELVDPLPRAEANATRLDWDDFWRLISAIQPFGEATGTQWPRLLSVMGG